MSTIANLEGYNRLFKWSGLSTVTKGIQLSHMLNQVNHNMYRNDPNYKAKFNRIHANHFSNQQKLDILRALENEPNLNKVRLAFRAVDMNLVERNNAYRNSYNRVANKLSLKTVRSGPQQGGTCWFHSIINGLLMSPRPRRLLRRMTASVPSVNFSGNACPTKSAGREWFLKYIKHRLEMNGPVHETFKNRNVILSSGLRGIGRPSEKRYSFVSALNLLTGGRTGGTPGDLVWFYNSMFPGQFTNRNGSSTPLFVMKKFGRYTKRGNPAVPHELKRNGRDYELSHAFISFRVGLTGGHAVAGYKTARGAFKAYDSAYGDDVPGYDWTRADSAVGAGVQWSEKHKTGGSVIHAIYMLKNA